MEASQPPPTVSIVISALDPEPAFLRAALQSVLQQSFQDFELILLEDPSSKESLSNESLSNESLSQESLGQESVGASLIAEFADARLRHVRNPQRVCLAQSRNRSLELARAELVAILDCDDVCLPDRLEKQVAFMAAHPEVAVLGSQILVMDADEKPRGYRIYPTEQQQILKALRRFNPMAHPSVMLRKSAVLKAGGYAVRDGAACDDYELWSRMATLGYHFANLPEALLRYRLHPSSMKTRRVRDTLRDTLWIKQTYWRQSLGFADRMRMWGEHLLTVLPTSLVQRLFLWTNLKNKLPQTQP